MIVRLPMEVLIVEDNPRDAEMIMRCLRRQGLVNELVHVVDGQEALDWLFGEGAFADRPRLGSPKLVLLDLKLPKVDGLEVLERMRSDPRTRHIVVVIMTSSREECDVLASYDLGANSYVVKPVEFADFTKAVSDIGQYWVLLNQPPTHDLGGDCK